MHSVVIGAVVQERVVKGLSRNMSGRLSSVDTTPLMRNNSE